VDLAPFVVGLLFVVFLGLGTGLLTGLSPGLHVNNVAALVLATRSSWSAGLAFVAGNTGGDEVGLLLACFVIATAASHAVFDFVPSVFFGAPTEETALAILPGHRLLLEGEGPRAVALAARGAVLGTILSAILLFPLRILLADPIGLADAFRPWTALFLVAVLGALLLAEVRGSRARLRRVLRAAHVQLLAGLLGVGVLRGPILVDPGVILLPLFSGLFGMPNLLLSLRTRAGAIPPQHIGRIAPLSRAEAGHALRGALAGAAVSWLPGLSGGAAATLAAGGSRRRLGPSGFMVLLGAVSSSTTLLSVAVLFMIGKTRSGTAAAVRELLASGASWSAPLGVPPPFLALLLAAVLASVLAAPLSVLVARALGRHWSALDPRKLSGATLAALALLIALVAGPLGLVLAGLATLVGIVPVVTGVRRVHLMAALLVPVALSASGV
jgi:putative membrane protein